MSGFEPWISDIGSDHSTNCAITTAPVVKQFAEQCYIISKRNRGKFLFGRICKNGNFKNTIVPNVCLKFIAETFASSLLRLPLTHSLSLSMHSSHGQTPRERERQRLRVKKTKQKVFNHHNTNADVNLTQNEKERQIQR